jgi:SAM-dependent methyltransferase
VPEPDGGGTTVSDGRGQQAAREVWGASPAGTLFASGLEPGTREFFEAVVERRSRDEMPWLTELVPFASFRDRPTLEIGCGAGYDAFQLCRNGATYTGIDITPENIERTRKHLEFYGLRPDLRVGDAEDLPFQAGTFDAVFSNGVLHHVSDIGRALAEARRVLKPGGDLWLVIYHRDSVFYWLNLWLYQHLLRGGFRRKSFGERLARIEYTTSDALPIVNVYSRRRARGLVRSAGFDIRDTWVRKLEANDLPAARLWQWVPRTALDGAGRWVGWYVIIHATATQTP